MFKSRVTMTISMVTAMTPIILYAILYRSMPDFVPIHYDGAVPDRFVCKWSLEVMIVAALGWIALLIILLLRMLLQRVFLRIYIENLAVVSRVWNVVTLLVTVLFAGIGICALRAMV
jgi:hypothetical protein